MVQSLYNTPRRHEEIQRIEQGKRLTENLFSRISERASDPFEGLESLSRLSEAPNYHSARPSVAAERMAEIFDKSGVGLAVEEARRGDYRKALKIFDAVQATPGANGFSEREQVIMYLTQAFCLERLGDQRAARAAVRKARQLAPGWPTLMKIAADLQLEAP
jgi:tetratricopeptide (TPR) repeat protein